jgi:hypothetical protein
MWNVTGSRCLGGPNTHRYSARLQLHYILTYLFRQKLAFQYTAQTFVFASLSKELICHMKARRCAWLSAGNFNPAPLGAICSATFHARLEAGRLSTNEHAKSFS